MLNNQTIFCHTVSDFFVVSHSNTHPDTSSSVFRFQSFHWRFQVFAHAVLYCTSLQCFVQSPSFKSLNIKGIFMSHSENKNICIFIRVLVNSFLLSNLLKCNIIHEILTSPTYTGMLPRVRVLRLQSYIMFHMVEIFISHNAICFQAPYQVQYIHYKTTIHLTTTASYAYSHLSECDTIPSMLHRPSMVFKKMYFKKIAQGILFFIIHMKSTTL